MEELHSLREGILEIGMMIEIIVKIIIFVFPYFPKEKGENDGPGNQIVKEGMEEEFPGVFSMRRGKVFSCNGEVTPVYIDEISPKGSSTVTVKKDMMDIL